MIEVNYIMCTFYIHVVYSIINFPLFGIHVHVYVGQYLPTENVKDIIRFCHEEGLMLFTDEVG